DEDGDDFEAFLQEQHYRRSPKKARPTIPEPSWISREVQLQNSSTILQASFDVVSLPIDTQAKIFIKKTRAAGTKNPSLVNELDEYQPIDDMGIYQSTPYKYIIGILWPTGAGPKGAGSHKKRQRKGSKKNDTAACK